MTAERVFTVVCTGRGSHPHHVFNQVTVTADELTCNTHRVANFAAAAGIYHDGAEVLAKAVMPVYNPRQGAAGWRWKYPLCIADERFTNDSLRAWLAALTGRVADISRRSE